MINEVLLVLKANMHNIIPANEKQVLLPMPGDFELIFGEIILTAFDLSLPVLKMSKYAYPVGAPKVLSGRLLGRRY